MCGGVSRLEEIVAGAAVLTPEDVETTLLTAEEAAALCGVDRNTIYVWTHRGTLTAYGERGSKRYRLLDVARAERGTRDKARR